MNASRPDPDELDRLLLATAAGDRDAFAALYDAVAPRVHGLVCRVVTRDLGDDAAQRVTREAMAELWHAAGEHDPARGTAMAFVLTRAHRHAVAALRAHRSDGRPAAEEAPTPDDHALRRRMTEMAYYEGRTCAEIARALRVSSDAVVWGLRDGVGLLAGP